MDFEVAKKIAEEELRRKEKSGAVELAFRLEKTLERSFGWVFFYNSKAFIVTGIFRHALASNGPIVVERAAGKVTSYGSTPPVAQIIASHESKWGNPAS